MDGDANEKLSTVNGMSSIDTAKSSNSVPKNVNFCTNSISALDVARRLAGGQDCDDLSDNEDHFAPILTFNEAEIMLNLPGHAIQLNSGDQNSSKTHFSTIVRQEVSAAGGVNMGEEKKEEGDEDEDASSCLGSSVTCSEASFELGRTEDFESHFTDQQRQQDAKMFVPDNNNNKSAGNVLENLKINNRSSAENGSSSVATASTILINILEKEVEQKSDQCSNVIEGNVRINDDDVNTIFSTINDQQKDYDNPNTVSYSYEKGKLVIATAVADGEGNGHFYRDCSLSEDKTAAKYEENCSKFDILVNNCEKIVGSLERRNKDKTIRLNDIENELASLDTNMPELNFDELEKHLHDAVEEREKTQREILSEEVRRRLAFEYSDEKMNDDDSDIDVDHKSFGNNNNNNRSKHKQLNVGMEICFVNDGLPSEEEDDFDDEDSVAGVPKSLSTPNLGYGKQCLEDYRSLERSASSSGDSEKRASELRRDALARQAVEDSDCQMRKLRLEREAKVMLTKAKQAARMQMELEKQLKLKQSKSDVEKIVGVTLGKRKLTRAQLSKMCITQLLIIINDLHARIQSYNEELVHLLIERDTLHMEQDSMLVDVQDLIQHQRQDDVKVPDFVSKLIDLSIAANNGLKKQFSFKLLKKVIPSISKD